ncbi:MAG TPA: chemotaxis protein CheB [Dongiaceae bacterium]|nr:chemotaxis protein CheB [Dongiaceae bacterium]
MLIAEDSPTQREMLAMMLEEAGGFTIAGMARDGVEAVTATERLRPDIVLMDCYMPRANGFEATAAIMEKCPTPIVMVSSALSQEEMTQTFESIKNGALAFLAKPSFGESAEETAGRDALIQTLRLMSEVKVVGRRRVARRQPAPQNAGRAVKLIAIAGSTGAPGVVAEILAGAGGGRGMPPILIVQHMARGFVGGFARWLGEYVKFPVRLAEEGVTPVRGEAYLAPDDRHLGLDPSGRIALSLAPAEEGFRPSANVLFRSAAAVSGASTLGVLLSGMGRDGATGLLALRQAGATTIAQDEASCVVFGMPREAIALGAAEHVLAPHEIARMLGSTADHVGGMQRVKR